MPDVTVDVDDLRLVGLGPFRPDELARAVERELARLIAEEGLPPALGHAATLDAGALRLRPGAGAGEAAAGIARAIHDGFSRGEER